MPPVKRQLCRFPIYNKLADLCERAGYAFELARVGASFELRVAMKADGGARIATPFEIEAPDRAACLLLGQLEGRK